MYYRLPMIDILCCGVPQTDTYWYPPKARLGSSNGYQMKLLAKCLVRVYMSKITYNRQTSIASTLHQRFE